MRRPQTGGSEPPLKRQKTARRLDSDLPVALEQNVDENDISDLKLECQKRKRDRCMTTIQTITVKTFSTRRNWIRKSQPPVYQVIEKYPSLTIRKVVSINSMHVVYCVLEVRYELMCWCDVLHKFTLK